MKKILIIGGGFTGMVAAKELSMAGHHVTIAESGDALGGLASSFKVNGEALEKAYHHIFRTDSDILQLINDLGIKDLLEWRESSVAIYRDGRVWPFMTPLDLLRFKPCSLLGRVRLGIAALYIKHSKKWENFTQSSAMEWMGRFCGNSALKTVWRPLLKGKFADYADDISMAWLWARLHVRSNSREPGGNKERLGYMKGGFSKLVEVLDECLVEFGVEIKLSTRVSNILEVESGKIQVNIGAHTDEFDQVLFTGANQTFEKLLSKRAGDEEYRQSLQKIGYLGAMCLIFTTKQKLGDHYWVNINEDDAPFLVFIRHTKLIPPERYNGEEVYYIGAYCHQDKGLFEEDDEAVKNRWFEYLKLLYPDFNQATLTSEHLFRFRNAQHIVKRGYEDLILDHKTHIPEVFISNFTQIYPEDRGMNFAVREGKKIAHLMSES